MSYFLRKISISLLLLCMFQNVYAESKLELAYQFYEWFFEARELYNSNEFRNEQKHIGVLLENPSSLSAGRNGNSILRKVFEKGVLYGGNRFNLYLLPALISDDKTLNRAAIKIIERFVNGEETLFKYHRPDFSRRDTDCYDDPGMCQGRNHDFRNMSESDLEKRYELNRKDYILNNILNDLNRLNETLVERVLRIFAKSSIDLTDSNRIRDKIIQERRSGKINFFESYLLAKKGEEFRDSFLKKHNIGGRLKDAICFLDSFDKLKKSKFSSTKGIECESYFKNRGVSNAIRESLKIFLKNAKNPEVIRVSRKVVNNLRFKNSFEYQYLIFFVAILSEDKDLKNISKKVLEDLIGGIDFLFKRERVLNFQNNFNFNSWNKNKCADEFARKIYDCTLFGFWDGEKKTISPHYDLNSISKRFNYFLIKFVKFEKDLKNFIDLSGITFEVFKNLDIRYIAISKRVEEYAYFYPSKRLMQTSRAIVEKYKGRKFLKVLLLKKEDELLLIFKGWLEKLTVLNHGVRRPLVNEIASVVIKNGLSEEIIQILLERSDELLAIKEHELKILINLAIVFSKNDFLKKKIVETISLIARGEPSLFITNNNISGNNISEQVFDKIFSNLINSVSIYQKFFIEDDVFEYLNFLELFKEKKKYFLEKIRAYFKLKTDQNYKNINRLADLFLESEYPEVKKELILKRNILNSSHGYERSFQTIKKNLETVDLGNTLSLNQINSIKNELRNTIYNYSYLKSVQKEINDLVISYADIMPKKLWSLLNVVGFYGARGLAREEFVDNIKNSCRDENETRKILWELFLLMKEMPRTQVVYILFIKKMGLNEEFLKSEFFKFIKIYKNENRFKREFLKSARIFFPNINWNIEPVVKMGTPAILVNSAPQNEPNYSIFEIELATFDKYLFYDRGFIFNAGGTGKAQTVKVTNGKVNMLKRDLTFLKKGSIIQKKFEPSSFESLAKIIDEIVRKKPTDVMFLFTGHGGKEGINLWSGDRLNNFTVLELYKRFDEQTTIRSIYLGCYSGAMIVDKNREVPKGEKRFKKFIRYIYGRKQCSLAKALHDETTNSLINGDNINDNKWSELFLSYPTISLQKIKNFLEENSDSFSSTVLSSDYLIVDFKRFICRGNKLGAEVFEICSSESEQYSRKLDEINSQEKKFKKLVSLWTKDLENLSDKHLAEIKNRIKSIMGYYPVNYPVKDFSDRDILEVEKLNKEINNYKEELLLAPYVDKYKGHFNLRIIDYFSKNENVELFPVLNGILMFNEEESSLYEQVDDLLYLEKISIARERKNEFKRERLNRDKLINIMRRPSYQEVYKIFLNLRACEMAPINI